MQIDVGLEKNDNLKNNMKNISLYIHIPFCASKCYYCNFVSFKYGYKTQREYVEYLLKEIELYKDKNLNLKTIFIGGGTPSVLGLGEITKIFDKIKECFTIDSDAEITIECNPNSFDEYRAREYKECGINRISFGLQSSNDKILKLVNRIHTKKDFIKAVKIAKKYGFKNINADMLIGLPNQTIKDVKNTLKLLLKLKIEHISCYSLILEEGTPLYLMVKNKEKCLPSEDESVKMYDFVLDYLKKHNIYRYEVSNFAKFQKECKHNLVYWNCQDYLGLGLNSHSKINNERSENFEKLKDYFNSLDENKKPIKNSYKLSLLEQKEEFIMLNLRKAQGINLVEFKQKFNEDLTIEKNKQIENLKNLGLIEIKNDYLFATDLGFKVLNQIILELV